MAHQSLALEAELEKCLNPHSVLRAGVYMDHFLAYADMIRDRGELSLPIHGDAEFAPVTATNISMVAAHMLDKSEGFTFEEGEAKDKT